MYTSIILAYKSYSYVATTSGGTAPELLHASEIQHSVVPFLAGPSYTISLHDAAADQADSDYSYILHHDTNMAFYGVAIII